MSSRKKKSELMLANDHASVTLSSLVYDPAEDNLLVAALTVASATELLVVGFHQNSAKTRGWWADVACQPFLSRPEVRAMPKDSV